MEIIFRHPPFLPFQVLFPPPFSPQVYPSLTLSSLSHEFHFSVHRPFKRVIALVGSFPLSHVLFFLGTPCNTHGKAGVASIWVSREVPLPNKNFSLPNHPLLKGQNDSSSVVRAIIYGPYIPPANSQVYQYLDFLPLPFFNSPSFLFPGCFSFPSPKCQSSLGLYPSSRFTGAPQERRRFPERLWKERISFSPPPPLPFSSLLLKEVISPTFRSRRSFQTHEPLLVCLGLRGTHTPTDISYSSWFPSPSFSPAFRFFSPCSLRLYNIVISGF